RGPAIQTGACSSGSGSTRRACGGATISPLTAGRKVGHGSLRSSAQRLVLRKKQSLQVTRRAFGATWRPSCFDEPTVPRAQCTQSPPSRSSVVYREMALFAADRFTASSPWRQPADDRQRLVETGHGDHVDAAVRGAPRVLEIGSGRDQEGVGAGVDGADRLLIDAADLVHAAGQVELAGDRDLVAAQQVAAAQRVVDLE